MTEIANSTDANTSMVGSLPYDQLHRRMHTYLESVKSWPHDVVLYFIFGIITLVLIFIAATMKWDMITPVNSIPVASMMSTLFLVSLLVERIIEVFLSVWVDKSSALHEQNLDFWQMRQGRLAKEVAALRNDRSLIPATDAARITLIDATIVSKQASVEEAATAADDESKALVPYKVRSSKVSTWVGLAIGAMVSAIGFRFLKHLVVFPEGFEDIPQGQVFLAVDVFLTGAVLAGGSKLIHEIFSLYNSFMDTSKKSVADQSKTQ